MVSEKDHDRFRQLQGSIQSTERALGLDLRLTRATPKPEVQ